MKLLKLLLEPAAFMAGLSLSLYLFILGVSITIGLLFGFTYNSPLCVGYRAKTTTIGELLIAPTIAYSCKKDSGLLMKSLYKVSEILEIQPFK